MDSPLLKHPLFYQITPQLLLNIAQIFLFTQSLSYAEKAYSLDFRVSKEYPSIKEIAFELLGILDDLKQFSKIKEPHIPPGAFLYTSVIYAISFYYGCSVFVRDYTPEGSLLFLRALEVLRTISNYYGTVDYWILMLLKERKDNQSYYSPPLSNKN
ncbi:hypothetical protein K502DRAFT_325746 [Neoconidiobolus thromboides FSU 785]|nr:hypothetical protein K502DRAFT_325746 [Neoconidiobolus thromboides FSU 785]